jgi:hypothetical protein
MHQQEADAEAKRRWGAKAGVRVTGTGAYLVAAKIDPFKMFGPYGQSTKSWEAAFRDAEEHEGKRLNALDLALPHLRAVCDRITANYPNEPYGVYDPESPSPSNVYRIVLDALTQLEYLQLKERERCPE